MDRLFAREAFRGSRRRRDDEALNGCPKLSFDLGDAGDALAGDDSDSFLENAGEVDNLGKLGFGTGRGFRYLSSGFIVRISELVELTLPSRLR